METEINWVAHANKLILEGWSPMIAAEMTILLNDWREELGGPLPLDAFPYICFCISPDIGGV